MCKVLGIIFLQTEWNGPIVRFLSNSYCVIVFPAWHESKKNEHSPRFEACLASKSRIPELETQPEILGNMYLLHYKLVKAVQVNIPYGHIGQSSAPVILPFCTSRQTQIQIGPKKVKNLKNYHQEQDTLHLTWPQIAHCPPTPKLQLRVLTVDLIQINLATMDPLLLERLLARPAPADFTPAAKCVNRC